MEDPELQVIVRDISRERDVIGVIIHRSSAQGKCDELSDVDVLIVVASGPTIHESHFKYSRPIDVYVATMQELSVKMRTVDPLNNNFALNALISGNIKLDVNGSVASLLAEARKL